ncbi:hypothetical protein [Streptomyces sp. SP17KL33]|uniref:hypothetical protein n=2 Tax=unclassified Streptomyces TaxID=2593676 RepID=UPI002E77457B|nr:hypothetical protein [Streptomyces sp. SP17KL33]MEE1831182.1 hypothetical protein [Streptomyces sp. SP17KL33]
MSEVSQMSNPQQPEQRRSDKGGATPQDSAELKARQSETKSGHAHGTDKGGKGGKGGGKGGGVPPGQQPEHP